jgi:hypothetical protein
MIINQIDINIFKIKNNSGTVIAKSQMSCYEVCAYKLCLASHWCGKALIRLFYRMPPRFGHGKRVVLEN